MSTSALNSLKVEDNGFPHPEGIPDHRLGDARQIHPGSQWSGPTYAFTCSCGFEVHAGARQDGSMSKGPRETWRMHVEGHAADPDEVIELGEIKKPRVTWSIKVINAGHPNAATYTNTSRWMKDWPNNTGYQNLYRWAVVVDKTTKRGKTSKTILGIYRTKRDAIMKGTAYIENQSGFDITFADQAGGVAVPTFKGTLSDLLTRTDTLDDQSDIFDVETTIAELDQVIGLIPVITARRDELARIYEDRTVGLLK